MGVAESKPIQKLQRIKEYNEELERNERGSSTPVKGLRRDGTDGKNAHEEESNLHFTSAASQSDPKKLRALFLRTNSFIDENLSAVLCIDPSTVEYPFENIVMEGGGNKGLAYVGSVKCLEELGMMKQIKRMGGASAGAITAALVALGYTAEEVLEFLSQDIESVFLDHSCGYFSLLPNLLMSFGWNPGNKIHEWFGKAIEDKTGDPDTTFYELYKLRGMELCIVATNLNLMTAQYCHPKTTPNMPIRDALRMTMAIPGVFSAMHYDNHGVTDVYVDGGVLANYPVNCFDGWYLSMAKEDAFLARLKSLDDFPTMMAPNNRFKPRGPNKTMGFLLFDEAEREVMRFILEGRYGALMPARPGEDTTLWLKKEEKKRGQEDAQRSHSRIVRAVDNFLNVLSEDNVEDPEFISKDELKATLENEKFLPKHKELLFGKDCDLDKAFGILDKDGNNKIAYYELMQFIEERGIRMQVRFQGYNRREVNDLPAFLTALQQTLLTNLKYTAVKEEDAHRTVGINTGHVGTMDYKLEDADRKFIVERGYNATMSFLRYYAIKHPNDVKERKVPVTVHTQQPSSVQCRNSYVNSSTAVDGAIDLEENEKRT